MAEPEHTAKRILLNNPALSIQKFLHHLWEISAEDLKDLYLEEGTLLQHVGDILNLPLTLSSFSEKQQKCEPGYAAHGSEAQHQGTGLPTGKRARHLHSKEGL